MSILIGLSGVTAQDLLKIVPRQEQDQSPEKLGMEEPVTMKQQIKAHVTEKHVFPASTLSGLNGLSVKERITVQTQEHTTKQDKYHKDTTVLALKIVRRLAHVAYNLMIGLSGLPVLQPVEREV